MRELPTSASGPASRRGPTPTSCAGAAVSLSAGTSPSTSTSEPPGSTRGPPPSACSPPHSHALNRPSSYLRDVPPRPEHASLLYEVIEARHGKWATIVSSNLSVRAWGKALGNPTLTASLVDRLMQRAHVT